MAEIGKFHSKPNPLTKFASLLTNYHDWGEKSAEAVPGVRRFIELGKIDQWLQIDLNFVVLIFV
jgi:hypothetical protein